MNQPRSPAAPGTPGTPGTRTSKRPVSLRNRISLVIVGVVAIALVGANLTVFTFASRGLDKRHDEQIYGLSNFAQGMAVAMGAGEPVPRLGQFPSSANPAYPTFDAADGGYIAVVTPEGKRPLSVFVLTDATGKEPPEVPTGLSVPKGERLMFETTGIVRGESQDYRALAIAQPNDTLLVTAMQTTKLTQDRRSLILIEVLATLGVLALLALVTRRLVGLSIRPLVDMELAAERIAHGDLTQRVDPSGPETEISRLGSALNHMLTEIEEAFSMKEASAQQLLASETRTRRFAADASHELRTPLTSIRGYAQLLRRGQIADPTEHAAAVMRIEQEATRLAALVDNLLVLSRLDEHVPLTAEPVDLSLLVGTVVDDARVVESDRIIEFRADHHVTLLADPDALTRVLTNLLGNACQHSPAGSPIEVVLRAADERVDLAIGGSVEIDVVDHGRGVAPEERSLIFDRFVRIDESRSRESGGAGLGLAIVAGILAVYDGWCEVLDTPGGGATFRIAIPAVHVVESTRSTTSGVG